LLICFHRLKGSAASIGLQRIARLAHLMEDLLQDLRRTNHELTDNHSDVLLGCVDAMRFYIAGIATGQTCDDSLGDACRRVIGLNGEVAGPDARPAEESSEIPSGAELPPNLPEASGARRDGPASCAMPASERQAATPAPPIAQQSRSESKAKPTETLRVDIERLDKLMNLAGQLVINKARFTQIGDRLKRMSNFKSAAQSVASAQHAALRLTAGIEELAGLAPSPAHDALCDVGRSMLEDLEGVLRELSQLGKVRLVITELSEAVHQLDRVSDGIQSTVMETRMVPIGPLFTRFNRVVRDLVRENNKDIALEILGENTELDKRMIDELGDPLIHLIRNSTDHGIELPDVRQAAGKPRQGTIRLNAYHRGNRIVIEITDDGRGLDADRILAKAISKGLVSENDAEKLTRQQIFQFIWQPGFSTAERVTEVSGRGMGMDIVWSKIEQINGTIELTSEPGKGTTFAIKLPLTMAILPSLLMVIDGDVFAVPVESVLEIVRVKESDLATVHQRKTAQVRSRVVSLLELSELFEWAVPPTCQTAKVAGDGATIVIVGSEGREIGLVVDSLLGEQDVVIKSIAENFQNLDGIAGASILGDGRVSLILDVGVLVEIACRPPRKEINCLAADGSLASELVPA
jgi:two-component system chemotaxis sensor kinase CheA